MVGLARAFVNPHESMYQIRAVFVTIEAGFLVARNHQRKPNTDTKGTKSRESWMSRTKRLPLVLH